MNTLKDILEVKRREVAGLEQTLKNARPKPSQRDFAASLRRSPGQAVRLLTEIKKASPSSGILNEAVDVETLAQIYEKAGAAAISVLTDFEFFAGSLADLNQVSQVVKLPILRKDFIIDAQQILEARLSGADAVLLMVCVLPDSDQLKDFRVYAESLGMDALVEVFSPEELDLAVESGAKIIGVNARDFRDLSVDLSRVPQVLRAIPEGIIRVAASGISTVEDLAVVQDDCDAILIGSSLMIQADPTDLISQWLEASEK